MSTTLSTAEAVPFDTAPSLRVATLGFLVSTTLVTIAMMLLGGA